MIKFLEDEDHKHLNNKMFSIHITNVCNLSCGGCDQFCGYFEKNKNWFIEISELVDNIQCFIQYAKQNWEKKDFPEEDKVCLLYGGEPTLHPKFEEIIKILKTFPDYAFCIYTNGRTFLNHFKNIDTTVQTCREVSRQVYLLDSLPKNGYSKFKKIFERFHCHEDNIAYRIDYKTKEFRTMFAPVLCAPCDIDKNKLDKNEYVNRAKKNCYQWNQCECAVYKNKAYACHVAASMDYMFFNGSHGWDIDKKINPFNKSKKEIDKQLSNFCYRCGYNINLKEFEEKMQINQYTHKGTLVTKTNFENTDKANSLLQVIDNPKSTVPKEVFR
jgi:organic radical activating enzyme